MREQQREAFAGEARREPAIFSAANLGPWRASVEVWPLILARGTLFEVTASWHGPPLPPLPDPGEPVAAADAETFATSERAIAIARRAADDLRAGRVPDLRRPL